MAAKADLDVIVKGEDQLSPELDRLESRLIRFVGAVSSALTAIRVASFPIDAIREFEAEMANVQKTTGFTDREIKKLSDSLVNMSRTINVSASDLGKIAAAAGQQGLGKEGVAGVVQFTESVSRMAAVLDLTAEQAGADIGKIASVFKIPLRDIERAVSSFNETSNNSTATGEQLLDVVKRIGDAAGSLDLDQSIGLSATGIDLGLSPEVVGTSFSKIFAEMYARADQFSELLGISVDDWINRLQSNGIEALKDYLQALRGLTPQAQQQQIKALSGGGRIGVLVTKLVNDVNDAVLDKNVRFASQGFDSATSAIKEQQTVLQTLDAETIKAGNSFKALGIVAGEQFAKPLAGYLAELNTAMSSERVIQFAKAVGDAFLDVFNVVADLIKGLASLNIQWENFITFAKIFAGLKLAQIASSMALNVTGLGKAWEGLATSATRAADAQAQLANGSKIASALGVAEETARVKELIAERRNYVAAMAQSAQAAKDVEAATKALADAEERQFKTGNALRSAQESLTDVAGPQITSAKNNVLAAEQAAVRAREQVTAQHNARLERAATEHATRLAAIEQARLTRQAEARAAGNRAEMLAATRDRNAALLEAEASQERSLRSINSYYARRLATVEAASAAEVAASRAALAATLSDFDGQVQSKGVGALQSQFDAANAAVVTADSNLKKAQGTLASSGTAASRAAAAFNLLGTGVRVAATALKGLINIAGKALFWLTLIYTVVEAFGLTESIANGFEKLTDWLGFTSEASRQLAKDQKAAADAMKEAAQATDEATEALQKYVDKSTNRVSNTVFEDIDKFLGSNDPEAYKQGVDQIIAITEGLSAKLNSQEELKNAIPINEAVIQQEAEIAKKALAEAADELASVRERFAFSAEQGDYGSQLAIKEATAAYDAQAQALKKLQTELTRFSEQKRQEVSANSKDTIADLEEVKKRLQNVFTDDSANLFTKFVPDQIAALKEVEEAEKARAQAAQEASEANGKANQEEADLALTAAVERRRLAEETLQAVGKELGRQIEELKATGGLSEAAVGSLDFLKTFLNVSRTGLETLLVQVNAIKQAGGQFTGTGAAPIANAPSGDGTADVASDAELRRQRRARLDVVKAGLEAEGNLKKEANDQQQDEDDEAYDRGLLGVEDYYKRRRAIEEDNLAIEMGIKQEELKALEEELGKAKEESEKLRTEASIIKAKGEIDLLVKQREAIVRTTERDLENALRDFGDQVLQERKAIADYFGASSDEEAFMLSLQNAEAEYRDWITRLETESKNMPELLPVIDSIKAKARLEAVEAALQSIANETTTTVGALDLVGRRLVALRDAGELSRGGYAALEERNRKAIIEVRKAELARSKEALQNFQWEGDSITNLTNKYMQLKLEIAGKEVDLEELELKSNETAKRINDDLKSAIEGGLNALGEGATLKEAFTQMLLDVVASVRNVAAEGLADIITKQLGSVGDGGFGGFFAGIFGETADTADALRPDDLRGATVGTPMYVQDVSKALGVDGATDAVGTLAGAGKEVDETAAAVAENTGIFEEGFAGLENTFSSVQSGLSSLGSSISTGFMDGINLLMTVFQTVGQAIVAAIFSSAASDATASAVGSVAGAAAGAAHTGGIVGQLTMKKNNVNPAVFANAMRYHSGGVAGLSPNEVPVILEKGEEVLTKDDPRHRNNAGAEAGSEGSFAQQNFTVQPVLSEGAVLDAMSTPAGRRLLVVHISKNPQVFRNALNIKQ